EAGVSRENPLVKVRVPITLFEFDLLDTMDGWLLTELVQRGADGMFGNHLQELENVANYLADKGHTSDLGAWGVSVSFHCLWVFKFKEKNLESQLSCHFAGYVDLTRVPLGLFAEKPVLQPRPSKASCKLNR